jgi:hypothetical protein
MRLNTSSYRSNSVAGHEGAHAVHDSVTKTYRHLNFFEHEYHLQARTPRVKLPNGSVRLVELDFAGRLNGFTLLFEAFILMLSGQMPFAAVSRINRRIGCWRCARNTWRWPALWPSTRMSQLRHSGR